MRIGIDCRTILNPGRGEYAGVAHYTYYLLKHLLRIDPLHNYVLFFDSRTSSERTQEFEHPNARIVHFPFSQYRRFLPLTYSHILITGVLLKQRLDLYHAPATSLPLTYTGRSVVTVHDLAIYKYPKFFPAQHLSTKLVVPRSIKRAKRIIAVSEATKQDLETHFHVSPKKIRVIYEGFSREPDHSLGARERVSDGWVDVKQKYALDKYLLFLGTIEPRKNLANLIKGFSSVAQHPAMKKVDLVLAGAQGWKYGDVLKALSESKLGRRIRYLGYVMHQEKMQLMENALAFVFPSLYEGFGLPVLEAMSLGTPVITSNVSSLPEITGPAAVYITPQKSKEIGQAIERMVRSPSLRKKLRLEGQRRAAMFTWEAAAKETLRVYNEVLAEKNGPRRFFQRVG